MFRSTSNSFFVISLVISVLYYFVPQTRSPALAALLVTEATLDAKSTNSPLFLATLDSQKAFDVVNHKILLDKLYHSNVNLSVWNLVKGMYEGLTARVKWKGQYSERFHIYQGVRQGGILSTHLYKLYINDLLLDLETHQMGKYIGTTYTGCPTCADDLSLMSENSDEFGSMLRLTHTYACKHRYKIHPEKSIAVCKNKANQGKPQDWVLGDNNITVQDQTTHLGLVRSRVNESKINVGNKISSARRTLYSLINVGCHGVSGLNPVVSSKIYQVYVLPRLLSGLETIHLTQSDLYELSLFHRKTLRSIQSLPQCTASSAVHLLLGVLPLEPEIHRKQLSLLHAIIRGTNPSLLALMDRQLATEEINSHSFFTKTESLLSMYSLPDIATLKNMDLSKNQWKKLVKDKIQKLWTDTLVTDLQQKSTLKYCNVADMKIGAIHPVWESVEACTYDVKKGITKVRMLTGTYFLPGRRTILEESEEESICQICRLGKEDVLHLLTRCSETYAIRVECIRELKLLIDTTLGERFWMLNIKTNVDLVRLILDSSFFIADIKTKRKETLRHRIEFITRTMCHRIHIHRCSLIQKAVKETS